MQAGMQRPYVIGHPSLPLPQAVGCRLQQPEHVPRVQDEAIQPMPMTDLTACTAATAGISSAEVYGRERTLPKVPIV